MDQNVKLGKEVELKTRGSKSPIAWKHNIILIVWTAIGYFLIVRLFPFRGLRLMSDPITTISYILHLIKVTWTWTETFQTFNRQSFLTSKEECSPLHREAENLKCSASSHSHRARHRLLIRWESADALSGSYNPPITEQNWTQWTQMKSYWIRRHQIESSGPLRSSSAPAVLAGWTGDAAV